MKRYQVGYPDIDNLVKITNRYWLYNLLLWPFLCEPVWPDGITGPRRIQMKILTMPGMRFVTMTEKNTAVAVLI